MEATEVGGAGDTAWGRPLSTWIRRVPSVVRDEVAAQADRWTLWTPVAFGLGCAAYFALLREPRSEIAWLLALAAMALVVVAARWSPTRAVTVSLVMAAAVSGGFATAKLRADSVKAPVAPMSARPQAVQGWVVDVASPGQSGHRLLIAPSRIGDWTAEATPSRIRVTLRPDMTPPAPGSPIRMLAILNPPPPPASPGSYDFARDAYFESVGAVGLALQTPSDADTLSEPPWRLRLKMWVNGVRWRLTQRIVAELGPEQGGLAAAMTTGHEAFVPREQVEDLRVAGLAHLISISGLHMAIVGGFAFAAARVGVAAWPWLALRVSGKKLAAWFGLFAVAGYLVLSGAPPPAQRAAITASVALLAILVDRQAISLHALALAAMIVMLVQPEAVTTPGFQMSFAATAALVALAEAWPRQVKEIDVPWPIRLFQAAVTWTLVSIAVSFVAGLATTPFAVQHFNRVSTWGLIANLAVAPISSFLLMPALAIGAALAPLGLGDAPLGVAGVAIDLINGVARLAATAPHAQSVIASAPNWTLAVSFVGLLLVCLWQGRFRWVGVPLALIVMWWPRPAIPDVWVSNDGAAVAVREGGNAVLLRPDVKLFGAELWARRRGLEPLISEAERDARYACARWSCAPTPNAPIQLAAAWNVRRPLSPGRLDELCAAELVILRNDFRSDVCNGRVVLTGRDFARGGSAELYRTGQGGWAVVWAQDLRGHRPWTWGHDPR